MLLDGQNFSRVELEWWSAGLKNLCTGVWEDEDSPDSSWELQAFKKHVPTWHTYVFIYFFHDLTQNQKLEIKCTVTPLRAWFSNQYINICAKTDRQANNQHKALSDWRKQDKSAVSNTTKLTWHRQLVWSSKLLFKAMEASAKCPVAMILLVMTLKTVILRTCTPIQELLCFIIKLLVENTWKVFVDAVCFSHWVAPSPAVEVLNIVI